jgi:hypothetical protein
VIVGCEQLLVVLLQLPREVHADSESRCASSGLKRTWSSSGEVLIFFLGEAQGVALGVECGDSRVDVIHDHFGRGCSAKVELVEQFVLFLGFVLLQKQRTLILLTSSTDPPAPLGWSGA